MRFGRFHKFSFTALFLAFGSASLPLIAQSQAAAPAPLVLFSPNGGVRDQILEDLKAAATTLDVAMYSFSDKGLWEATNDAAKRGLKVRIVLNNDVLKPSVTQCDVCDVAEKAGVDIRYTSRTLHHKFALIDVAPASGPGVLPPVLTGTLLTGSGNWSVSSNTRYDEDFVRFSGSAPLVSEFSDEFDFLWTFAQDYPGPASAVAALEPGKYQRPSPVLGAQGFFTSQNMSAQVSAAGKVSFKGERKGRDGLVGVQIVAAIDAAQSSLKAATAHFRRPDIYEAMKRALARGVKIEMVLDGQEFNASFDKSKCDSVDDSGDTAYDECLKILPAPAKLSYKMYSRFWDHKTAEQMHSKYVIVDDSYVLTGSFNWSYTAETSNFENLLKIEDPSAVQAYMANYEKISKYGEGKLPDLIKLVQSNSGTGPCFFEPITLESGDIVRLRAAYAKGACKK